MINHIPTSANGSHPAHIRQERCGMVLVVVLVVVSVLSLAAYTFCDLMVTQHQATNLGTQQIQARWLIDSGVDAVRLYLLQDKETQESTGGHYNNPEYFQAVNVVPDIDLQHLGNFTVISPQVDDEGGLLGIRYGLEDESTRLNINILLTADELIPDGGRTLLMALPGMETLEDPESIADAIMDWIDEDDEPREYGAELEYYQTLQPPYAPKNGPLETVEELLLVRGITPELLFGRDLNRNGILDEVAGGTGNPLAMGSGGMGMTMGASGAGAMSGGATDSSTLGVAAMDRGWSGYLTLHSKEKNVNAQGEPRIYLNGDDLTQLHKDLKDVFNDEWAQFIIAYRQTDGDYDGNDEGTSAGEIKIDLNQAAKRPVNQVLDLIGKQVEISTEGKNVVLRCPFPEDGIIAYITQLMDSVTVNESKSIPGRININQASQSILAGIPGMSEEVVEQIISQRLMEADPGDTSQQHETWLLTSLIVTLDEMKQLMPFITARGDVHRAQIVGYYEDGGAASRAEVVFDATGELPRIVFWRDISHLGRGYSLELLGFNYMEDGTSVAPASNLPTN
jgi:type II secretory pathway component PulK